MKKFFLVGASALFAMVSIAAVMIPHYIITDCGTTHQIPSDSSVDLACDLLDYWSSKDC